MTKERAIEILNPEHREHFESIETVNEACRMGMKALEKQIPKKPVEIINDNECQIGARIIPKGAIAQKCPVCDSFTSRSCNYCQKCGQALDWSEEK